MNGLLFLLLLIVLGGFGYLNYRFACRTARRLQDEFLRDKS